MYFLLCLPPLPSILEANKLRCDIAACMFLPAGLQGSDNWRGMHFAAWAYPQDTRKQVWLLRVRYHSCDVIWLYGCPYVPASMAWQIGGGKALLPQPSLRILVNKFDCCVVGTIFAIWYGSMNIRPYQPPTPYTLEWDKLFSLSLTSGSLQRWLLFRRGIQFVAWSWTQDTCKQICFLRGRYHSCDVIWLYGRPSVSCLKAQKIEVSHALQPDHSHKILVKRVWLMWRRNHNCDLI